MKRTEAESVLSGLAGFTTPLSALAQFVSLTDTAKQLGYRSVQHALTSLQEQQIQRLFKTRPAEGATEGETEIGAS